MLSFLRGSKTITYIFILCIYDVFGIILYVFGVINYANVKMNILKNHQLNLDLKKKKPVLFEKLDPRFYESVANEKV